MSADKFKIGVISDTHGHINAVKKAFKYFEDADLIIHSGDVLYHAPRVGCTDEYDLMATADFLNSIKIPIIIAQGNCDPQFYEEVLNMPVQAPYAYAVENGIKIVATHGHLYYEKDVVNLGKHYGADFMITGHTHVPVLSDVGGLIRMNPGSPALPKFKVNDKLAPSIGIITEKSARIINIEDGSEILKLKIN